MLGPSREAVAPRDSFSDSGLSAKRNCAPGLDPAILPSVALELTPFVVGSWRAGLTVLSRIRLRCRCLARGRLGRGVGAGWSWIRVAGGCVPRPNSRTGPKTALPGPGGPLAQSVQPCVPASTRELVSEAQVGAGLNQVTGSERGQHGLQAAVDDGGGPVQEAHLQQPSLGTGLQHRRFAEASDHLEQQQLAQRLDPSLAGLRPREVRSVFAHSSFRSSPRARLGAGLCTGRGAPRSVPRFRHRGRQLAISREHPSRVRQMTRCDRSPSTKRPHDSTESIWCGRQATSRVVLEK